MIPGQGPNGQTEQEHRGSVPEVEDRVDKKSAVHHGASESAGESTTTGFANDSRAGGCRGADAEAGLHHRRGGTVTAGAALPLHLQGGGRHEKAYGIFGTTTTSSSSSTLFHR